MTFDRRWSIIMTSFWFLIPYLVSAKNLDIPLVKNLMLGLQKEAEVGFTRQDMKVIGAGFGRTGTTSFTAALERLGLKSYHMVEGVAETPGHAALWEALIDDDSSAASRHALWEGLATSGFNATADFPACVLYQDLMERYPAARVVLTVRGDGDGRAWARSALDTILRITAIVEGRPFCWSAILRRMSKIMTQFVLPTIGAPVHPTTRLSSEGDLAHAYDAWIDRVKSNVPPENLLVFAARDGWEPLCTFLSPVDEAIANECTTILANKEPYPFVNDRSKLQKMVIVLQTIRFLFSSMIPTSILLFVVVVVLRRRSKRLHDHGTTSKMRKLE